MTTLAQAFALLNGGRKAEGVLLVTQLANAGNPAAMTTLGEMKWGGTVAQDPVEARLWFERADAAGDKTARHYVTNLLASGIAGARNWGAALDRLRQEAERDAGRRAALALVERMKLTPSGDPVSLPQPIALSEQPYVRRFERLLTASECEYLRALAEPAYAPSTVYDAARRLVRDPIRTSDSATLHWLIEDPAVHALNRRLAAATGTDSAQGEAGQLLRYKPGQQYHPHLDFVRASDNQRVLTALVYLNHDYQGGETRFTKTGLTVRPKKGDALVFRNALPDRQVDQLTEHAGMPVRQGIKYLYSRWIRERRWAS